MPVASPQGGRSSRLPKSPSVSVSALAVRDPRPDTVRSEVSLDTYSGHAVMHRRVSSAPRYSYDVILQSHIDQTVDTLAAQLAGRRTIVVTTPSVDKRYASLVRSPRLEPDVRGVLVLDCNEATKSLARVEQICAASVRHGVDRDWVLVSVGGGVCSDLVTVAASWLRRGVSHMRVPTTLIGQVDAGIGAKGAVNFADRKSYLGCFHPPEAVLINPSLLASLPRRHLVAGLAEMAKLALISDERLLDLLEAESGALLASSFTSPPAVAAEAISRSVAGMLMELEVNLFEHERGGRRADLGHTFSPLIESATDFRATHGEAVAMDLLLSASIATDLDWLEASRRDRISQMLAGWGLLAHSDAVTSSLCSAALLAAESGRGGDANLVVPVSPEGVGFVQSKYLRSGMLEHAVALLRGASRVTQR